MPQDGPVHVDDGLERDGGQYGDAEPNTPPKEQFPPKDAPPQEAGPDPNGVDKGDLDWGEPDADVDAAMQMMEEAASTPLFANSTVSSMGATYFLLSQCRLNKCTNTYIDELFRGLSMTLLTQPNTLPRLGQEASQYLRRLGHSYTTYDVCPNHCKLSRGALAQATACPECRAPRRKTVGKSQVPQKVARYFPSIPRFKRMFRSPIQAAQMTWWAANQGDGSIIKHVSDSRQWRWIQERYHAEFAKEDRNLRLALITDGFNPMSDKRGVYSLWPVLLMNYNIAPWLTTKNYFIMLAILIHGLEAVKSDKLNVFLEPLIEELLHLWEVGVYCIDAARYKEESHFLLKAMVLWTIGDYPAYGMLAGCVTKGYVACPVCGPGMRTRRSRFLKKMCSVPARGDG